MKAALPRIIISGTGSGAGKTTVAVAIMAALTQRGLKVQPFKAGPDYIDPGYHNLATGRLSRNLDSRLIAKDNLTEILANAAGDADIAVIEGVMGLFDGDKDGGGSTAELAKLLDAPVILVADVSGQGQSAAAAAAGFRDFDPAVGLAGVILNRVGSDRHYEFLKESLARIDLPVLGALFRDDDLKIGERHLGLIPGEESAGTGTVIDKLGAAAADRFDLQALRRLADGSGALNFTGVLFRASDRNCRIRIGVAKDQAFSFYYQDNLDIIAACGGEIVYFSPLADAGLPGDLDGLYLGGGFPEVFAAGLAANESMRQSVGGAIKSGMPTYAECGGLIYLSRELKDLDGRNWPMCATLAAETRMTNKLQALGYRRAEALVDNLLVDRGDAVSGHEFHYSNLGGVSAGSARAYLVAGSGNSFQPEGFVGLNLLASYIHLHFATNRRWAEKFVGRCRAFGADRSPAESHQLKNRRAVN